MCYCVVVDTIHLYGNSFRRISSDHVKCVVSHRLDGMNSSQNARSCVLKFYLGENFTKKNINNNFKIRLKRV